MRRLQWLCCGASLLVIGVRATFAVSPIGPSPHSSSPPSVGAPVPVEPPSIRSLLRPELVKRVIDDREVAKHAQLETGRYSFYAAMLAHAGLERTRRVLTNYELYAKLVPFIETAKYSPIEQTLEIYGGVLGFYLRSWVRFDERSDQWIHYRIVRGHFAGLEGDIFFENEGEKGTLVYFAGSQRGDKWPPAFVIERGAEIDPEAPPERDKHKEANPSENPAPAISPRQDLPRPRSRL
jgi:hypothetical protein